MAFIPLALTALFLVGLPLLAVLLFVAFAGGAGGPEPCESSSNPTTLQLGKRNVLDAMSRNDLAGAKSAFLEMVDSCGSCHKLPRKRTLGCAGACGRALK